MINNDWKTTVINAKTRPGVDCDTDHILVTATLRAKAYKQDKASKQVKYNLERLQDDEVKKEYQVETHNRFSALLEDWKANEKTTK